MGRLLFFIVVLSAIVFIGYQLLSFFFAINSTKSQKKRDAQKLRAQIQPLIEKLVKLSDDELELLSINQVEKSNLPGINTTKTGIFTSIYHEPLIAYGHKSYGNATDSITIVCSSSHEFIYESSGRKTKVSVDGQLLGTIHSDGNLYDMKDRVVAHIEADDVLATHPVKVGQREVGEIINPMLASSPNPRAYSFLDSMDYDEKVLFMSLTLLSLVEESVG